MFGMHCSRMSMAENRLKIPQAQKGIKQIQQFCVTGDMSNNTLEIRFGSMCQSMCKVKIHTFQFKIPVIGI